jgi:hypothetical protein
VRRIAACCASTRNTYVWCVYVYAQAWLSAHALGEPTCSPKTLELLDEVVSESWFSKIPSATQHSLRSARLEALLCEQTSHGTQTHIEQSRACALLAHVSYLNTLVRDQSCGSPAVTSPEALLEAFNAYLKVRASVFSHHAYAVVAPGVVLATDRAWICRRRFQSQHAAVHYLRHHRATDYARPMLGHTLMCGCAMHRRGRSPVCRAFSKVHDAS